MIHKQIYLILLILMTLCLLSGCGLSPQKTNPEPQSPTTFSYDLQSSEYQELLSGKDDQLAFYSGMVTILAGESGEQHSTEKYEEIIVTLEGEGEVRIKNEENLNISTGNIAYIPKWREHQVFNTGEKPLKYIYIATESE